MEAELLTVQAKLRDMQAQLESLQSQFYQQNTSRTSMDDAENIEMLRTHLLQLGIGQPSPNCGSNATDNDHHFPTESMQNLLRRTYEMERAVFLQKLQCLQATAEFVHKIGGQNNSSKAPKRAKSAHSLNTLRSSSSFHGDEALKTEETSGMVKLLKSRMAEIRTAHNECTQRWAQIDQSLCGETNGDHFVNEWPDDTHNDAIIMGNKRSHPKLRSLLSSAMPSSSESLNTRHSEPLPLVANNLAKERDNSGFRHFRQSRTRSQDVMVGGDNKRRRHFFRFRNKN